MSYKKRYAEERRERLKSQGICQNCGKNPLVEGSQTSCRECRDKRHTPEKKKKIAEKQTDLMTLRKSNGLCIKCGERPIRTESNLSKKPALCQICLDKDNERRIKRTTERISQGICSDCGIHPLVTKTLCQFCRDDQLEYRQKNIQNGLCADCGKIPPIAGGKSCGKCKDRGVAKYKKLKDAAYEKYGGYICKCCGETWEEFLTIDHINNDGAKMRKIHGKGVALLQWLKKNNYPEGFQIYCINCQFGKQHNNGVCPHQFRYQG